MVENLKKSKVKKRMIFDSLAVVFIAVTPFLYKIYDYLPVDDPNATVSFLGMTIGSNGFADVSTYVWFLSVKIIPFVLLLIWFFTSREWWYHILLIPIAMYAFQLFEAFYSEDDYVDTENIWWLLPVCMVVIPAVYFIRIKLYDKYVHGIDLEAMDAELKTFKNRHPEGNKPLTTDEELEDKSEEDDMPQFEHQSFTDYLNSTFSTANIQRKFKQFQNNLKGWMHLKS